MWTVPAEAGVRCMSSEKSLERSWSAWTIFEVSDYYLSLEVVDSVQSFGEYWKLSEECFAMKSEIFIYFPKDHPENIKTCLKASLDSFYFLSEFWLTAFKRCKIIQIDQVLTNCFVKIIKSFIEDSLIRFYYSTVIGFWLSFLSSLSIKVKNFEISMTLTF